MQQSIAPPMDMPFAAPMNVPRSSASLPSAPPSSASPVQRSKRAISEEPLSSKQRSIPQVVNNVKKALSFKSEKASIISPEKAAVVPSIPSAVSPAARMKVVALCCEGSGEDSFNQLLKGKEAMSLAEDTTSAVLIELAKIKCPIISASADKDTILNQIQR